MFWEKFQYLSKIKGIKPHAVLKELEISSGSANNWKKGTIPNGEILKKIADYFEVSIDSLLDFDENVKLYVGLGGYKAGNGEYDEETWLLSDSILADEYDILSNNKSVRGFMLYSYSCLEDDTAKKEINNLINALN